MPTAQVYAEGPVGIAFYFYFYFAFTYYLVLYLYLFITINYFNMVIFFNWTGSYLRIAVSTRPHVMTLGISPSQVHVEKMC